MTRPVGRPRKAHVSEADRRRSQHAYLRSLVKKGVPGAEERLRTFRQEWADEFKHRSVTADSYQEEEFWHALHFRWQALVTHDTPLTAAMGRYWPRKSEGAVQKGTGGETA